MSILRRFVLSRRVLPVTLLVLLAAQPAAAVPFEAVYGPTGSVDLAARRVEPVNVCPMRGFIAVGTSDLGAADSHIYVVRTDTLGNAMWENVYDLSPAGQDEGRAIVEMADGTGFVILADTYDTSWSAALLRIDCAGNALWAQRYGWASGALPMHGTDLIMTTTGDASQGTAAGDFVVAGYVSGATPIDHPFLFRTRSDGTLIWNRAYAAGSSGRFNAVTEATPGFGATGDLVAAGNGIVGGDPQALVARVSGDNGLYGGPNRCFGHYGDADMQSFFSVIELRTAPYTGHLVFAGLTYGAAYWDDIYLVRSQANPCAPLAQARLGDANQPQQIDRDMAFDLREIRQPLASGPGLPPIGSLVLTGNVAGVTSSRSDVPLLAVDPGNFGVLFGRLFGSPLPGPEVAYSLERIPNYQGGTINGYVIAGIASSDPQIVGDVGDLYLIATDAQLDTPCSRGYHPILKPLPWPNGYLDPRSFQPATSLLVPIARAGLDTDYLVCF